MKDKLKVAVVFGGRSTEHEISLLSAQNVISSLDTEKFDPILIGIDKDGQWHYNQDSLNLLNADDASQVKLGDLNRPVLLSQNAGGRQIISLDTKDTVTTIDVIFPVLHGTYGEDGSIQGFAKLANIPCVGCGILGSAVGMDKDIMKRILRDAGIGVAKWMTFRSSDKARPSYEEITMKLGHELFIKPANLGSSVGVSFTKNEIDFNAGLENGFLYDPKVIVEEKIVGRELEVAVLGNEYPEASIPGEVIPQKEWYSFESKYLDESGALLKIPAELNESQIARVRQAAIETYTLLECEGLTRVDMFLTTDDDIIINEVNTIPGFTKISMYPKLWEYSGLSQKDLISKLIELAIDSHEKRNNLKTK